ncbi:NADase-type glycan-binding domain-containing protein [Pyxidicoccus sp. 3LFB2]
MFTEGWKGGARAWGPLRVLLGCVLLSTGAWGQFVDAGQASGGNSPSSFRDVGQADAGLLSPSSFRDAGQADAGGAGASAASDAGGADAGVVVGPSSTADAGPRSVSVDRVEVTLHGIPITVTASSVLVDAKDAGRYGPANLLDEDPGTLWAEGAKGSGAGAWVELGFPPNTPVHAFLVTPGNAKSAKLYKANARPRKAKLELKLVEGRRMAYELDFPRDFPAGGAIYVNYERKFAVHSARLTVLTVWPGSRYPDLCLGGFVPVFRGPPERSLDTFLGAGRELAPTLTQFIYSPILVFQQLPPEGSGVPARLRAYSRVPHDGPLPPPEEEYNMHRINTGWSHLGRDLANNVAAASGPSELFRFIPVPGGKSYVFGPLNPPRKGPDSFENFRVHWARIEDGWYVVGVDVLYREQTGDD